MQTDRLSSSQFLVVGDEGVKAFNMSVLGDTSDYQWKEFQGSVQLTGQVSSTFIALKPRFVLQKVDLNSQLEFIS